MATLARRPARRQSYPTLGPAAPAPRPKPAQTHVSAAPASPLPLDLALVVVIRGVGYQVTPLDPGPDHTRAWRLSKSDGEVYDVCRERDGRTTSCTCGDFVFRREGQNNGPCKHGLALIQLGLLV